MSDRLPYEEQLSQQLNDLPLPDENIAWEDMKRRLEKDDDNGIIPIWLRGCGLWGLLLLVLVGIGWWLLRQPKNENKKEQVIIQQQTGLRKKKDEKKDSTRLVIGKPGEQSNEDRVSTDKNDDIDSVQINKQIKKNKHNKSDTEILVTAAKRKINKIEEPHSKQRTSRATDKIGGNKKIIDKDVVRVAPGSEVKTKNNNPDEVMKKNDTGVITNDSSAVTPADTRNTDTTTAALKDSIRKIIPGETVQEKISKKDSSKQKSVSFSAGIAVHQLLPVDGQKLTPYNSQGRKGSLSDYIPSIFFRMYKNDKWFIQSEFRYGAPQSTKEIIYQQIIIPDSSQYTTTLSSRLKKTFYHQLPLTFNYYIRSNWSLGAGIVWNMFSSAVYEQELVRRNNLTAQDSSISKSIQRERPNFDSASAFSKNYLQTVIETQYQWKRFSLGARYSFGLQPYLKFTLPGGTEQNERNRSLQVFLRYELWKSKAKSLKEKRR